MTKEREHVVAAVLEAAGGRLVGRVRLQKAVYLLDQLGLESGFRYEYHHFGPYSRDLDNAMGDAKAFGLVVEEFERRQRDGAAYSVFRLENANAVASGGLGRLDQQHAREVLDLFAATNITVLELAATVHWLLRYEGIADWRAEIARRKPVKVGAGRLEKAVSLLGELGLSPTGRIAA